MFEKYRGKKLLLLAGIGSHCKVVEAAKEMQVYTIVTDYLNNSPAKIIADESLMLSILDVDNIVDYCKTNCIDGVMSFCVDPASKPLQEINEKLGIPNIGTVEQVLALTNKRVFKNLCIQSDVDVIPEYSFDEIIGGNGVYPILVKPVDSRGSRGALVCKNMDEFLNALPLARAASSNGETIVEKYMGSNQDLTITYLVKDGEPHLISIGDRYSGKAEDNLERQLVCTIQPSRFTEMYLDKVNDRVIKMIRDLGIRNAPVFMQGFVDDDTVRMYDPGIRFPGNEYERIFTKATGINPMKSMISYFLSGEMENYGDKYNGSYYLNGLCAIQYMINVGPGTISTFKGLNVIASHPYVVDVQQKRNVGERIFSTGDINHRVGEISILIEKDPERMKEVIRFIQSNLIILDEFGNDMIISPFDSNKLDELYNQQWFKMGGMD